MKKYCFFCVFLKGRIVGAIGRDPRDYHQTRIGDTMNKLSSIQRAQKDDSLAKITAQMAQTSRNLIDLKCSPMWKKITNPSFNMSLFLFF